MYARTRSSAGRQLAEMPVVPVSQSNGSSRPPLQPPRRAPLLPHPNVGAPTNPHPLQSGPVPPVPHSNAGTVVCSLHLPPSVDPSETVAIKVETEAEKDERKTPGQADLHLVLPSSEIIGKKRKTTWTPPPKGVKRTRRYIPNSKPPAMVLKEHCAAKNVSSENLITDHGKPGDLYKYSVKIDGVTFIGKASSKKLALHAACESALRHSKILSEEEEKEVVWLMPPPPPITEGLPEEVKVALRTLTIPETGKKISRPLQSLCSVSRLMQVEPKVQFEITSPEVKVQDEIKNGNDDGMEMESDERGEVSGKKGDKRFICTVTVPDVGPFSARGRSKSMAKKMAAWTALRYHFKIDMPSPRRVLQEKLNAPFGSTGNVSAPESVPVPVAMGLSAPKVNNPTPEDPMSSPAARLYAINPGLSFEFDVEESGVKVCTCEVDGISFKGIGRSKKDAKHDVCRIILEKVFGTFLPTPSPRAQPATTGLLPIPLADAVSPLTPQGNASKKIQEKSPAEFIAAAHEKVKAITTPKNPVSLLCELYRDFVEFADFTEVDARGKAGGYFTISLKIFGRSYVGHGSSKKMARNGACRAALAALHGLSFAPNTGDCLPSADMDFTADVTLDDVSFVDTKPKVEQFPTPKANPALKLKQGVADMISQAVNNQFKTLTAHDPAIQKRKVLAGVVMTRGSLETAKPCDFRVVCVTSGTKCVSGGALSLLGDVVQDCHAEILARRCLRLFFLSQMEFALQSMDSIFTSTPDGLFVLKDDVQFHLYISSAPCGDARIFCNQEQMTEMSDAGFSRKNRGLLRTKVEGGEGTIPVPDEGITQTFDAIVGGARMLTMSCSDKLCRWNVTGFQGALMSQLMDKPVYFSSIVLGSLFQPEHMERALVDRVAANLKPLPVGYELHKPVMGVWSSPEVRSAVKSPSHAINWIDGMEGVEVLNCGTGKLQLQSGNVPKTETSRLCKAHLFDRWSKVWQAVSGINPTMTYGAAKGFAGFYQEAKTAANSSLNAGGYSFWVKKPIEVDSFGRR